MNLGLWPYFGIDDFFASKLLQRKNGQNYQCVKCGKWYSTRSIMLRHMNHGKIKFIYKNSRNFKNLHSRLECGVEKKIQCKLCYKKFRRKWNLEQHHKRIHTKSFKSDDAESVIRFASDVHPDDGDGGSAIEIEKSHRV